MPYVKGFIILNKLFKEKKKKKTLLIILIKPLTTKAYDRRASGDCGTSGSLTAIPPLSASIKC